MKIIPKFVYAIFAAVTLHLGAVTANGAVNDLFVSVNGSFSRNHAGSIYHYTSTGVQSIFAAGLSRPRGVAFDSAGNLFVATNFFDGSDNCCQGAILKIAPNGTQSTFANPSGYVFLVGLAIDNADNVFVSLQDDESPTLAAKIYKFTPGGLQSTFASFPGQVFGLAVDSAGNLYQAVNYEVAASQILKFTPDGASTVFATEPSGTVAFTGLAFDRSGNLFVSASIGAIGQDSILKFTPNGTQSTFATGLTFPRGLAFNRGGTLFVAEIIQTGPGDILRFTPSGIKSVFASGIGLEGNGGPEYLAVQPPPTPPKH